MKTLHFPKNGDIEAPEPTFTLQELELKIRELAEEKPDFVYISTSAYHDPGACKYTSGQNCGGCIMGQAIIALQPELIDLLRHCDLFYGVSIADVLHQLFHDWFIGRGLYALRWFKEVQSNQDKKMRWKEAVKNADYALAYGAGDQNA